MGDPVEQLPPPVGLSPHPDAGGTAASTVLLVEDDAVDAGLIQEALASSRENAFRVEWVRSLSGALKRLHDAAGPRVEIILLDLSLPDGQGLEAFDRIFATAPEALILVLSGQTDEETARQAVQRGAQDYLAKGQVDAHWLPRALRYILERRIARVAWRDSEARFRAMSDASPLGIFVSDTEGGCVYTNAAYHEISGLSFDDTLGTNWSMAIHPDDRERVLAEWRIAAHGDQPFQSEFRFQQGDDSIVWVRVNSAAMEDGKKTLGLVQTVEDISERKVAADLLFEEKERAQVTLNSIGDAVLTTDLAGRVTYLNLVAERMTGWSNDEAQGRPLAEVFSIIDGTTREPADNPAQRAIAEDRTVGLSADCLLLRRDGSEAAIEDSSAPIHNRQSRVTGAVIVFHDVSESRALALKMAHLAQHDFLTGLPNRMLLTERLTQAIGLALRHRKQLALLFLDLDYFKHVNDSLGHVIGDRLLKSVAARLGECVRATDTVCRQGGDEFVILLTEIEQQHNPARVAEKLLAAFAAPHRIDGHELHVTLSIGVSIYPDDGSDVGSVMQAADTAMYHAKAEGRNNCQFFRAEMNTSAIHRLFIESSLRRALKDDEFLLHYQPKINLASGKMTGNEALIRWHDPELGLVLPDDFVPIAEESGLIVPIGRWALHEACRQTKAWLDAGLDAVPVSVNISAVEFRHKDFLQGVAQILEETELAPHYLELELTESVLMHDTEVSAAVFDGLKAMKVRLAIDDFGTGYSSLSYLKRFPIDTLKIDQLLVRDIASDADDATIVSAVIGMGRNLKQQVVAEGIETIEQLAFLRTQLCDSGQGFLFSRPLSAGNFTTLLTTGNSGKLFS